MLLAPLLLHTCLLVTCTIKAVLHCAALREPALYCPIMPPPAQLSKAFRLPACLQVRGIRCFVTGDIRGVADAGGANGATAGTAGAAGTAAIARPAATAAAKAAAAGEVLATCEAMLVDIKAFL